METYLKGQMLFKDRVTYFKYLFIHLLGVLIELLALFWVFPMLWGIDTFHILFPFGFILGTLIVLGVNWFILLGVGMVTGGHSDSVTVVTFKDGSKLYRVIEAYELLGEDSGIQIVDKDSGLLTKKELRESYPDLYFEEN